MKKLKINLAVIAVLLGGGAAFAGAGKFQTLNVYNTKANSDFSAPNWAPISGGAGTGACDAATQRQCKGHKNNPSNPSEIPTDVVLGNRN
ncbi:hypothetical protein GS399_03070 [Pedobacter sp. HMF7647]|uniref:Uncharacterized protein n=1 Tax=Hufsiella arboris TaxID=2695275 RepID=A0A7K1Y741_9SPHI|nr:hypothetical protein [Hufsiella arboris]MXV49939.1 hypothetical protein [Hufsiella arboris]